MCVLSVCLCPFFFFFRNSKIKLQEFILAAGGWVSVSAWDRVGSVLHIRTLKLCLYALPVARCVIFGGVVLEVQIKNELNKQQG